MIHGVKNYQIFIVMAWWVVERLLGDVKLIFEVVFLKLVFDVTWKWVCSTTSLFCLDLPLYLLLPGYHLTGRCIGCHGNTSYHPGSWWLINLGASLQPDPRFIWYNLLSIKAFQLFIRKLSVFLTSKYFSGVKRRWICLQKCIKLGQLTIHRLLCHHNNHDKI